MSTRKEITGSEFRTPIMLQFTDLNGAVLTVGSHTIVLGEGTARDIRSGFGRIIAEELYSDEIGELFDIVDDAHDNNDLTRAIDQSRRLDSVPGLFPILTQIRTLAIMGRFDESEE